MSAGGCTGGRQLWLTDPADPTDQAVHLVSVSLQVVVYTRQGGKEVVWDVQWTDSEGETAFFLVPG